MIVNYKDNSNFDQIFLREQQFFNLGPDDLMNSQYTEHIMQNELNEFQSICESLPSILQNENSTVLRDSILDLLKYSKHTTDENFSSIFLENQMPSFLISLFSDESSNSTIDNVLIDAILIAIDEFTFYSIDIMIDFMEQQILQVLIEHCNLFKNEIKHKIIKIISNFISEDSIKQFDIDYDNLIRICHDELFLSNDYYVEEKSIHLLTVLSNRDDIINDIDQKQDLYEIFVQVFNHELISQYSQALTGIYSLAQTESGCDIIINDQKKRTENAVIFGLNFASEDIEYNSLLLAKELYSILDGDRLNAFHSRFPLNKLSLFLVDKDKFQKGALNIIYTIVYKCPQFIKSLLYNGVYIHESDQAGLIWIFKRSEFDLKRSASYIIMCSILNGDDEIIDYLIDTELICYATETITSDPHFFNEDDSSHSELPALIDALLRLLNSENFKERIIDQLTELGIYDMICDFETGNEDIDCRFDILRNLIEEQMEE